MNGKGGVDPDARSVGQLLNRSRASEFSVRIAAVSAMTRLARTPEVLARLTEMLDDQDEAVIMAAAEALLVGPADAGAEVVLTRQTVSDDVEVAQAIADIVPEAARYPYVVERVVNVAGDNRVPPEVRASALRWVADLSQEGYPLSPSVRASLRRNASKVRPVDEL